MALSVKQGLKRKAKLIQEIKAEFSKVHRYNSVIEGSQRVYDPMQAMNAYFEKTESLIKLKAAIHKANLPVYDKIFRLSELKSIVSNIRSLDCEAGPVYQRGGYGTPDSTIQKTAVITIHDKDHQIEELEKQIDELQDALDTHNATTFIDWTE